MSLLLDALKRAEEAKRLAREGAHTNKSDDSAAAAASADPSIDSSGASAPSRDAGSMRARSEPLASREVSFPALSLEEIDSPPSPAEQGRDTTVPRESTAGQPADNLSGLSLELLESIPSGSGEPTEDAETPPAVAPPRPAPQRSAASATPTAPASTPSSAPPRKPSGGLPFGAPKPAAPQIPAEALLEDEPLPSVASGAAARQAADATKQREGAKNVFAAKRAGEETADKPKWVLPVIAVVLCGVGVGGWYVWNEINRVAKKAAARSAIPPAMPVTTAPPPAPPVSTQSAPQTASAVGASGSSAAPAPSKAASTPAAVAEAPALPPLIPPEVAAPVSTDQAKPSRGSGGRQNKAPVPPASDREALAAELQKLPPLKEGQVQLKVAREPAAKPVPAGLISAYSALTNADYSGAKRLYATVVAENPHDVDAHLGLATAAARLGERDLAETHYRRAADLDPSNATAAAGLIAMLATNAEGAGAARAETELRALIAKDAKSAAAHFALGNLYAANRRWQEAQSAYFEAYRLEPNNADYIVNLAISLDRLGQAKLALGHYRRALQAKPPLRTNRAAVEQRVAELATRETGTP